MGAEVTEAAKQPLCPVGDGQHKRVIWQGKGRSGQSCRRCHKTWEWVNSPTGTVLAETYSLGASK